MAHMKPLPESTLPQLQGTFDLMRSILGFVPNSVLTMQRKPKLVEGFGALTKGVMDPDGEVDLGFKRLIAHMASFGAACQYCEAHSLIAAGIHGISEEKLASIWDYERSPLFTDGEKVALEFAQCAGAVPNAVTPELFDRMRAHWSEGEIVEILGAVCLYGFLNRWNDSMATDLEDSPREAGDKFLKGKTHWTGGKHVAESGD